MLGAEECYRRYLDGDESAFGELIDMYREKEDTIDYSNYFKKAMGQYNEKKPNEFFNT